MSSVEQDMSLMKLCLNQEDLDSEKCQLQMEHPEDCPCGPCKTAPLAVFKLKITAKLEPSLNAAHLRKDVLLRKIRLVDLDIVRFEGALVKLRKLEEELKKGSIVPASAREESQERLVSTAQQIYTENRRKAAASHSQLSVMPLYNQPCDTGVFHENSRRHLLFRERLCEHLRREKTVREERARRLVEHYTCLQQDWRQMLGRVEVSSKWRAKETKYRQIFEKSFPKDLSVKKLKEREAEDSVEQRRLSVVPPLLLDERQRRHRFINNNGRVHDFATEYNERLESNIWSKEEREIFKEQFLQTPKDFRTISSFLERKNTRDCVQFYYLTKKEENYKQLCRKPRRRRKVNDAAQHLIEAVVSSETGVMTRHQLHKTLL